MTDLWVTTRDDLTEALLDYGEYLDVGLDPYWLVKKGAFRIIDPDDPQLLDRVIEATRRSDIRPETTYVLAKSAIRAVFGP